MRNLRGFDHSYVLAEIHRKRAEVSPAALWLSGRRSVTRGEVIQCVGGRVRRDLVLIVVIRHRAK
jgi:hypothetical protein